jgi:WS/DGAT/MGAT family acyltransferase
MQRLAGVDATFLYMETPNAHMHVTGVILIDPSTMPGGYSFETIQKLMASRIHLLAPFRRRLVMVPFGIDHPVWIEDPDFDLESHIHRIGVPRPGSMHELADVVADIGGRQLDRTRPLWEMWVVEGIENGHVAIVTKMHHSAVDGVTGAELMAKIFDLEPDQVTVSPPPDEWRPEPRPNDVSLLVGSLARQALSPVRMLRLAARSRRNITGVIKRVRTGDSDAAPTTLPFTAPRTPFSGAITPHRSVAFSRASLDDLKVTKKVFGTTVNDVVLAACAGSLRNWLSAHGGLPDKPLVATCPVSVREEGKQAANQVSAMFVALPVQMEDPVARLLAIHQLTIGAKEMHRAVGADTLTDWAEFASPAVFARAARLYTSMRLADRHRPIHNLVISNVPGPPVPLYCAGARVEAVYPLGPVMEGAGLNITVLSNIGNVDFGAIACREAVPDLWDIADGFAGAISELRKLADQQA